MNSYLKLIALTIFYSSVLTGCKISETYVFQTKIPFQIQGPYYQTWVSGVQGGGSGINVFLPVKSPNGIIPDSLHFRGQRVRAFYENNTIVGRFKTPHNQRKDVILSQNPLAEAKNKLIYTQGPSQFKIDNNSCVLSYQNQNHLFYVKIKDLTERPSNPRPSAPPILPSAKE